MIFRGDPCVGLAFSMVKSVLVNMRVIPGRVTVSLFVKLAPECWKSERINTDFVAGESAVFRMRNAIVFTLEFQDVDWQSW